MKLKIVYILLLLFGLGFSAEAQKKKPAKKTTKAAKKAVTKAVKKAADKKLPVKKEKNVKALAKDSVIKGATIEIIQSYKPEIKQASKPESVPALPPVDTTTATLNMNVPPQRLNFAYNSLPLKPLALARDSGMRTFRNYLKAGGGNLSTILIDAGISELRGKNYETAIHLHHLSQSGNIQDQKSSLTGLEANGSFLSPKHRWHTDLGVLNNIYNYYGFNYLPVTVVPPSTKLVFTGVNIGVDMQNTTSGQISYHPSVKASYYVDNSSAQEQKVSAVLPVSYDIDTNLKLRIGLAGYYSSLFHPVISSARNSNIAQLLPGVDYTKGSFVLNAGLYPTIGQSNSYLLPDIRAAYTISNTQLTIFAGWQGLLAQNAYEQISTRNPYLSNLYALQQTHTDEVFGGMQTYIGNHISFSGKVSWWQYENMPLMMNDTLSDIRKFVVVYDKVNAFSLQGAVRYHIGHVLSAGVSIIYTSYNTTVNKRPWHEPGLRMNADVLVQPIPGLTITAYLSAMDEIYSLDKGNKTVKLNSTFDLGAGAEYSFIPRLSAFVNANNIFNNQYERWYGYRVYGFNIFAGVRLKF